MARSRAVGARVVLLGVVVGALHIVREGTQVAAACIGRVAQPGHVGGAVVGVQGSTLGSVCGGSSSAPLKMSARQCDAFGTDGSAFACGLDFDSRNARQVLGLIPQTLFSSVLLRLKHSWALRF